MIELGVEVAARRVQANDASRTEKRGLAVEQEYFDYGQAGQFIGKTAEAIRGYVNRGMLRVTKRGRKLRFISRTELVRFCSGL